MVLVGLGWCLLLPLALSVLGVAGSAGLPLAVRRGGRRVEAALHSDTPPLLFRNPGGGPRAGTSEGESLMAAGEMLVFDRGLMHCHTGGDYRRTVTFEVRS